MKTHVNMKSIIAALIFISFTSGLLAQDKQTTKLVERAERHFAIGNYEKTKELCLKVLDIDNNNAKANFFVGMIILEISKQKWNALPYLLKVYDRDPSIDEAIDYYLGLAYQYNYEFEHALSFFSNAKTKISPKKKEIRNDIDERIVQCQVGIELNNSTTQTEIENLGPKVNSPSDDYAPVYSTADEKIIFTSNRRGSKTGVMDLLSGNSYDDIYEVDKGEDNWNEARNIGSAVNTKYHDSGLTINQHGNTMLVYQSKNNGDIFMSEFINGKWSKPISLGETINTPKYMESSASLSSDGKTLFFTSTRPGGFGGTDIYVCERNDNGGWSEVENLGATINTEKEEEAPYISSDGNILFFSSTGHKGIGGFDIFYSVKDAYTGEWGQPQNLGIPVNTPQNDIYFVLSKDGKNGYYSAIHKDTHGERDIYRVNMVDELYENATLLANSDINPQDLNRDRKENQQDEHHASQHNMEVEESTKYNAEAETTPKFVMRNVYFDVDKNKIRNDAYERLNKLVTYLKEHENIGLEVSGHTDNTGSEAYNSTLSKKRAEAILHYLVDNGIAPSRLVIKGYGRNKPLASNDDERDGRMFNRRVEFEIFDNQTYASLSN